MRQIQIVLIAIILLPCLELSAQEPLDSLVRRLNMNQRVRVRLHDRPRVEGRVAGVADRPVALRLGQLESLLPTTAIDSLWVRGRATWIGTILGGTLVAAAAWLALCPGADGCDGSHDVQVVLGGFGVGALLGAGVGTLIPKWRLKYGRVDTQLPAAHGRPQLSFAITLML